MSFRQPWEQPPAKGASRIPEIKEQRDRLEHALESLWSAQAAAAAATAKLEGLVEHLEGRIELYAQAGGDLEEPTVANAHELCRAIRMRSRSTP